MTPPQTAAAVTAVVALAAGCVSAPPDLPAAGERPAATSTSDSASSSNGKDGGARDGERDSTEEGAADEVDVQADPASPDRPDARTATQLRAGSFERHARQVTLRIRTVGPSGIATGSGFAIAPNVLITNQHVIDDTCDVQATTWDGQTVDTEVASVTTISDLAVVRTTSPLPATAETATTVPQVGDPVVAVGYPRGERLTVTDGHLTRILPAVQAAGDDLFSSAPIQPGNSGGPLFNADGQVVGVVYAIWTATGESMAVPVATLDALLDDPDVWRTPTGTWC